VTKLEKQTYTIVGKEVCWKVIVLEVNIKSVHREVSCEVNWAKQAQWQVGVKFLNFDMREAADMSW